MANDDYKIYQGKKVLVIVDARISRLYHYPNERDYSATNESIQISGKLVTETDNCITLEDIASMPISDQKIRKGDRRRGTLNKTFVISVCERD